MRRTALLLFTLFFSLFPYPFPKTYASGDVIILTDPRYMDSEFTDEGYDEPVEFDESYDNDPYYDPDEYEDDFPDDTGETEEYSGETAPETEKEDLSPIPSCGTDAVLVIDVSGSMKQSDPNYLCRKAAMDFAGRIGQDDASRIGLVIFSDTIQDVIPLTGFDPDDPDNEITQHLNALTYTNGDTDIGSAMEEASRMLCADNSEQTLDGGSQEITGSRTRSILLLTDGEIDLPKAADEEAAEKESLTKALLTIENAKQENIVIHTVTLDLTRDLDRNLMTYMADSTGGTASLVTDAADLKAAFLQLYDHIKNQHPKEPETEEMTEAETESETEEMTETETETEKQSIPIVRTVGNINGPVHLKGLLPGMCKAQLSLSDLFTLEGSSSYGSQLSCTAYAEDNTIVSCAIEGNTLTMKGLKNGSSTVHLYAEPAYGDFGDTGQGTLTFSVQIDALIPSPVYLLLIPSLAALAVLLVFFLRHRQSGSYDLSGTLQWYVRGENEKIFGIPGQTAADLSDYGSKVRLSELVRDDLVSDADLDKVVIRGLEEGILITSRSSGCMLQAAGCDCVKSLEMPESGRFKILCETDHGKAAVIAYYSSEEQYRTEPSYEDDSEERTRMLI